MVILHLAPELAPLLEHDSISFRSRGPEVIVQAVTEVRIMATLAHACVALRPPHTYPGAGEPGFAIGKRSGRPRHR